MRYLSILFVVVVPFLGSGNAWAVSPDELRALSGATDRDDQQRANRAKTNDTKSLLPPEKETPNPTTPQSGKYGASPARARTGTAPTEPLNSDTQYTPPARDGASKSNPIYSDSVPVPKQRFGIRLGQWIEANLERNTSSAEPGMVELRVTSDVAGEKRTMRAGTLIYASKSLNGATKRLEIFPTKGITPDGHEFTMKGLVFDVQRLSGLNGIMQVDSAQIAKHSGTNAALAAVAAGTRGLAGSNPLGAAASSAAQTAVSDTDRTTEFNTSLREVIYVSPQPVMIRVEEMF